MKHIWTRHQKTFNKVFFTAFVTLANPSVAFVSFFYVCFLNIGHFWHFAIDPVLTSHSLGSVFHFMTSITVDSFKAPKCESLPQTILLTHVSKCQHHSLDLSLASLYWYDPEFNTLLFAPSLTNLFPYVLCLCKWYQHFHHSPCQKPRHLVFPYSHM